MRRHSEGGTRELLFSLDEGMTWGRHLFFSEDVKVYSLLTEHGQASTVFLIFCARLDRSGWISVRVDLRSQFREYSACQRGGSGLGGFLAWMDIRSETLVYLWLIVLSRVN